MPRQARQASGTGIYHVMMRGINHQNVTLLRYIHQNPVKAGMVSAVRGEWFKVQSSRARVKEE